MNMLTDAQCARRISRRRLLRIGGASVAGVALPGVSGCGDGHRGIGSQGTEQRKESS